MDIRKVKKLIEMLEESNLAEIEIHEGEESVRISRSSSAVPQSTSINVPQQVTTPSNTEPLPSHLTGGEERARPDFSGAGHVITAPMVGVFYTSPAPDESDFVNVGDPVKTGDVMCIIEAMKIMNQIECDTEGKLKKVLVESGEAVEYGQPLFVIEKTD